MIPVGHPLLSGSIGAIDFGRRAGFFAKNAVFRPHALQYFASLLRNQHLEPEDPACPRLPETKGDCLFRLPAYGLLQEALRPSRDAPFGIAIAC